MGKYGTPTNYGYIPDIIAQESLAAAGEKVWRSELDSFRPDMDKSVMLYRAAAHVCKGTQWVGSDGVISSRLWDQGQHGSCVGWGEAGKIWKTICAQKALRGARIETEPYAISPSWCYGASREVVGQLGGWEGSNGSWAAKATAEMGFLYWKRYDSIDLSQYRTSDCKCMGSPGSA